jgi:hypothetical protein
MNSPTFPNPNPQTHSGPPINGAEKEAVLRELESILGSPFFRTSNRSKQFLAYVVHHTLEDNHEPLKERTIGAKLFQRPAGYSTGDDPVVRVQAGEVRRRLDQYHHAALNDSPVRIELPVGSYAPEFRWIPVALQHTEPTRAETSPGEPAQVEVTRAPMLAVVEAKQLAQRRSRMVWMVPALCLALILGILATVLHRSSAKTSAVYQFWSPVFSTSEPVLICLAKPAVYLPSAALLQKYSKVPGAFTTELQRLTQLPPLHPQDKLVWGDMVEYSDYGVAAGDVYAAVRLSALLGRMGKESQVRIGSQYSFADLRNSPAVVVGAFNNRWTMQMTSNLHFAFVEENGEPMIREQGPAGRAWHAKFGPHGEVMEDFGIVTRLLNSKTGQFVISTAGTLANGTQAAGEFVSSSEYLEEALRNSSSDWAKKNLQFVIQTTVTDSVPGPPQVVAIYTW